MSAERAHEILAQAGPRGALAVVHCHDKQTRQTAAAHAAETARANWDGSLEEFLASLDPGSTYDWLRTALGQPTTTNQ